MSLKRVLLRRWTRTAVWVVLCCINVGAVEPVEDSVAGGSKVDVNAILNKLDRLYRSDSSYAEMTMEIVTPHWQRTLEMRAWSEGMDKTFIRILAPRKERGVGTLRLGNEMWNYLPKTDKIIKIPPSMMMSSWMGSDFTNDDLVREYTFIEDYDFELAAVANPEPDLVYITCRPKAGRPIIWEKVILAVRRDDWLPVREEYFDEKGDLMRVLRFSEIMEMDGRTLPTVLEMIPQDEEGKTVIRYQHLKFDVAVEENVFTLRHLRVRLP